MAMPSICIITKIGATDMCIVGISETPTSVMTFKWRWLRIKLGSSLRSMKKDFSTTSTSKRSTCSITVNECEGLKGKKNVLSSCSDD